jgi:hypothetical protein
VTQKVAPSTASFVSGLSVVVWTFGSLAAGVAMVIL